MFFGHFPYYCFVSNSDFFMLNKSAKKAVERQEFLYQATKILIHLYLPSRTKSVFLVHVHTLTSSIAFNEFMMSLMLIQLTLDISNTRYLELVGISNDFPGPLAV